MRASYEGKSAGTLRVSPIPDFASEKVILVLEVPNRGCRLKTLHSAKRRTARGERKRSCGSGRMLRGEDAAVATYRDAVASSLPNAVQNLVVTALSGIE